MPAIPCLLWLLSSSNGILPNLPKTTLCVTFHDIVPERNSSSLWFDCSVSEFRDEIGWLRKRGANFITLDELYAHLHLGAKLPAHPVCLTFADNYMGFYKYAYPLLKEWEIPSAMFVHTGYVGSRIGRPKMDWPQLQEIFHSGLVDVESQTVTHPIDLRKCTSGALQHEMADSKSSIEKHLDHPCSYLAYPNGKFDVRCERAAQRAGYKMAFSEQLTAAESSPSIYCVSRFVHTKFVRGWNLVNRIN